MTEARNRPHLAAALVALAALLLYARTVGYEYVWDDQGYLSGARTYVGVEGAIKAFTEPFFLPYYYRPVALFSFVFSWQPAAQHFINTQLHAINVVLVFYCARAIMPRPVCESRTGVWAPALAALAFAAHPAAVEAVAWVSGRFDTLMCSFVLGTCLAALGGELTRRRLAWVFVLFACALGCKESAVGLPVTLPFLLLLKWRLAGMDAAQVKEQAGALMRLLAVLALALMLYLIARWNVIHKLFANGEEIVFAGSGLLDKLNISALAVTAFAKLIVAPMSHSAPLHPFKFEPGGGVMANTLIVMVCVFALLAAVFLKRPKLNFPLALLAALAMSWPVLHIMGIPNRDNIISDRYALAPLALLLAALAAVAGCTMVQVAFFGRQRIAAYVGAACLLWVGALMAYSSATIPLWRNEVTLWTFAHEQVPESRTAYGNYISTLMARRRWQEANAEMERFMDMFPEAGRELGNINRTILMRARTGNYDGARELFLRVEAAISQMDAGALDAGDLSVFYGNMGLLEFESANLELAERYLEKALRLSHNDVGFAALYDKIRAVRAGGANSIVSAGKK